MANANPRREPVHKPARRPKDWREYLKGGRASIVTFVIGTVALVVLSALLLLVLLLRHPAGPGMR
jgi:hypothetical protein